ncbi:polyprenyl synthetase family protein [Ramlibacter sp. AW1]|uniref:Polyprenyl synthetase family protein n=1 Tax=Ramlibacter aurantiacus TaxID=2801330 RepID=A0A937D3C3_9BURK|nr:polyprenyl synthetase family protein [Ramlibacter aurantiacus]MBL0419182.1 polyprenyl synthetase family protein [Ramlibacter aurantiacus]
MSFARYWAITRLRLDAEFNQRLGAFFDPLPERELGAVREVLSGGKRLRATLACLVNESLGGAPEAAIPRALAIECVQAASLVHDDWVDGDTLRRDRPATWTRHGPRRAVLLGDLMFATALRRMAQLGRDDVLVLAEAIAAMAAGASQEPLAGDDPATAERAPLPTLYPRLIHLKTGVLFGAAARLGAQAAGAVASTCEAACAYGARAGQAYQLADDLRDLLGSAEDPALPPAPGPLLAPALAHFCGHGGPADAAMLACLRDAMQANLELRLRQAEAAADRLPARGQHQQLLKCAPREIVGLMRDGAPAE